MGSITHPFVQTDVHFRFSIFKQLKAGGCSGHGFPIVPLGSLNAPPRVNEASPVQDLHFSLEPLKKHYFNCFVH